MVCNVCHTLPVTIKGRLALQASPGHPPHQPSVARLWETLVKMLEAHSAESRVGSHQLGVWSSPILDKLRNGV